MTRPCSRNYSNLVRVTFNRRSAFGIDAYKGDDRHRNDQGFRSKSGARASSSSTRLAHASRRDLRTFLSSLLKGVLFATITETAPEPPPSRCKRPVESVLFSGPAHRTSPIYKGSGAPSSCQRCHEYTYNLKNALAWPVVGPLLVPRPQSWFAPRPGLTRSGASGS